jgi:hypothetical protein
MFIHFIFVIVSCAALVPIGIVPPFRNSQIVPLRGNIPRPNEPVGAWTPQMVTNVTTLIPVALSTADIDHLLVFINSPCASSVECIKSLHRSRWGCVVFVSAAAVLFVAGCLVTLFFWK